MSTSVESNNSYTKWNAESDNVDMESFKDNPNSEGNGGNGQVRVVVGFKQKWSEGWKSKCLKACLFICLFISGLLTGYFLRQGVHEYILMKGPASCPVPESFGLEEKNAKFLKDSINSNQIMDNIKVLDTMRNDAFVESEASYRRASEMRKIIEGYGLEDVELDKFDVLTSHPERDRANEVTLVTNFGKILYSAVSPSIPIPSIQFGSDKLYPYTLYSASGSIQKEYIYGHYGRLEDYETLAAMDVDVRDKILVLRVGKNHVANKVKLAESYEVAGILLYPDPGDYKGKDSGEFLDKKVGLPSDAIILANAKMIPGDPETPNTPSTADSYRLPEDKLPLPKIPIQPISSGDAFHILNYLDGPIIPKWKGGMSKLEYRIGPKQKKDLSTSSIELRLNIRNKLVKKSIYNVITTVRGKIEPGRYVIIGNQLGAWNSKGMNSGPSDAIFLEILRCFAALLKTGWRPSRSIICAAFDGQELGNVGMDEWLQAHEGEIMMRTVAYFGVGQISGFYSLAVQASPLLKQAVYSASKEIPSHVSDNNEYKVYDIWKSRRPLIPNDVESEPKVEPPGTTNDFLDPFCMRGIPTAQFHFVGNSSDNYPFYHTKSYTFDVVQSVVEPQIMESLAKVIALSSLKIIDSLQLPISAQDYPKQILQDLSDFIKEYGDLLIENNVTSTRVLVEAVKHFSDEAVDFDNTFSSYDSVDSFLQIRERNDRLLQLEKSFIVNPLYGNVQDNIQMQLVRNMIYGPDPDDVGNVATFPRLRAAIHKAKVLNNTDNWDTVKEELSLISHSLHNAIGVLSNNVLLNTPLLPHSHH